MQRKFKFDAEDLNVMELAKQYSNERKARRLFEAMRWADGKPICPRCGFDEVYRLTSKKNSKTQLRPGVYCCAACRKPFTATVGTVFEDSHLPLSKILMAIFILCSSKKSVSALQLSRMLKTTYRTAWFLAHRIRHAMKTDLKTAKPLQNTVEADETFTGRPHDSKGKRKRASDLGVVALVVERGGMARTRVISSVTAKNVGQFLAEHVSKEAVVNTDEHASYRGPLKDYKRHDKVVHSRYEYARRNPDGSTSHVNTCESFFSLFKRGVFGSWHAISREHLPKYASEFEFRWNTRKLTDGERMANFLPLIAGKRLTYKRPASWLS